MSTVPGGSLALTWGAVLALESRIEVISDGSTIYIKRVPGDDLEYRLATGEPFVRATTFNYGYSLPGSSRTRGILPIQIRYRFAGFTRTTVVAFDADEHQLRQFFMGMESGGEPQSRNTAVAHHIEPFFHQSRGLRCEGGMWPEEAPIR